MFTDVQGVREPAIVAPAEEPKDSNQLGMTSLTLFCMVLIYWFRNLTNAARKVGISAAELLDANPDQKVCLHTLVFSITFFRLLHSFQGILPGQGQGRKDTKAAASPAVHPAGKTRPTQTPTLKTVGKPTIKLKPKPAKPLIPVIQPTWTKLYNVPREITREHIEERMFIREFILRFSSLMSKETKAHLDELGEIIGDGSVDWVANEDDQNQDAPDIPLVSWVSEKCIRSVVFGLLGIYADEAAGPLKKVHLYNSPTQSWK